MSKKKELENKISQEKKQIKDNKEKVVQVGEWKEQVREGEIKVKKGVLEQERLTVNISEQRK